MASEEFILDTLVLVLRGGDGPGLTDGASGCIQGVLCRAYLHMNAATRLPGGGRGAPKPSSRSARGKEKVDE
jgi:hypothetical protein